MIFMKAQYKRLAALVLMLALLIPCLPLPGAAAQSYTRLSGKDRYATSLLAADALKDVLGVETFDTVILASGTGFADALAGSYLAAMRSAPILLVSDSQIPRIREYLQTNLSPDGTVYLLGGKGAVSAQVEESLSAYNVIRLSGANRYATNMAILEEAGLGWQEVLICTGKGFADSLSASAVGRPILLVGDALTREQEELLARSSGQFVIIGGTGAVNTAIEEKLSTMGSVTRLSGRSRYETSVEVAVYFFGWPSQAVLAYAQNFPDGLSGGPLAYALGAPLLLTATGSESAATHYANYFGISGGYVLGGKGLISDDTAEGIFGQPMGCIDKDMDHYCDDCFARLSDCFDNDGDGYCDYCYWEMPNPNCADNNNDHFCDDCGKMLSYCQDSDKDHYCDTCGIELTLCADWSCDHFCDICGIRVSDCQDYDDDHLCDTCGIRVSDCQDSNKDHLCDICGVRISDCADANSDHSCDHCGDTLTQCDDADGNGFCDICETPMTSCVDLDHDHLCDDCGNQISYCCDDDLDHVCDFCGVAFSLCEDTNNDHRCDECGEFVSYCTDTNRDHDCDICGIWLFSCEDADGNGICDECRNPMATDACADNDSNHFCDECGARLSGCNDSLDHFCDLCGKQLSSCWDADHDHSCEYCGQTMSGCDDSDGDYVCDICGELWGISETQYSTPYAFPEVGYITTEAETVDTGDLVYHIGENVYVPGHLQQISTVLAETAQRVSGLTFAGTGYAQSLYPDDKIHVTVSRDQIPNDYPYAETGAAYADRRTHAMLPPGDLFLQDIDAIPHEISHVMRFKQSGWDFPRPLEEGFAEFTSHWILKHLEETDPTSAFYLGRSCSNPWNMSITDYDALYAQPIEYWLEHEFPYSGNTYYCVGFRFMYYLQDTYGSYSRWITDYEAAYPCTAPSHSWEGISADLPSILDVMKQTYGADVLDNFYPWLRENQNLFEPVWDVTYVDATAVDAVNLYPRMYDTYSHTELYRMDYEDLYVNLESVRSYLENYKGIDASTLTLYNPDKITVNLYHADGSYVTVYGHEEISLADISYIKLVGNGRLDLLRIYGYEGCKQEWE